jgi:hypothetical protein
METRYAEMAKRRVHMDKQLAEIDEEQKLVKYQLDPIIAIVESQKDFNFEIIKKLEASDFLLREEHILIHRILIEILDNEIIKIKNPYLQKVKEFDRRRDLIMVNY